MTRSFCNIFIFICCAVLFCITSCASSDKANSKSEDEQPMKSIQEVIGSPKEKATATEQNKVIWSPQNRFSDKEAPKVKLKVWELKPE